LAIDPDARTAREEEILLQKESRKRSRFIYRIISEVAYPSVYAVIRFLDLKQKIKSLFHRSTVSEFTEYQNGQKIALIAIWEYQDIRKDIRTLIEELKKRNFFVCLVNTGKINQDSVSKLADIYIERFNYGRDFGSYKDGIEYLQKTNKLNHAEKLLVLNDSVYYLQDLIGPSIDDFLRSHLRVVGATENFEINHHLGSFFIMFDRKAINSKEFKNFWRKFRKSDVRTKNIRYGEMRLTRKLSKAVSESELGALWSLSVLSKQFETEQDLSRAISLINRGHITNWKKLSWQFVTRSYLDERIIFYSDLSKKQGIFIQNNDLIENKTNSFDLVLSYQDSMKLILKYKDSNSENKTLPNQAEFELLMKAKGLWILTTASGSQIHQNNNLLVSLGCPLVKLDLIYRGAFSYEDAEILFTQISNKEDIDLLRNILYRRAHGLDVLRGWKRSAFTKGLI
jgi:hypothetical protein